MTLLQLLLAYLLISNGISGHSSSDIRRDFHDNKLEKADLKHILDNTKYLDSPTTDAYLGMCESMMAEHLFLPTLKLQSFNKGKKKIEKAIKALPENAELRYIRLMVQLNTPNFLNYNDDIQSDLDLFVDQIDVEIIDDKWKIIFVNNLLGANKLNEDRRIQLISLKNKYNERGFRSTRR